MRNESIPKKRTFVEVLLDESWDDLYFHMEQRYPQGIILTTETKEKAASLRKTALVMGKRLEYAISTSVQDTKLYIWQL